MSQYMLEFAGLMAVFSIIIVAPGADFAIVLRQAIVHGRRAAILTSIGIGCSLLFHIGYTILGLGLIVSKSLFLFGLLKWAGAAYLVWLGVKSWFSAPFEASVAVDETADRKPLSGLKCFAMGFATNALNPKPVMFFLSLFSALVSHETPAAVQAVYGVLMASALIAWFVGVSMFFTVAAVRERFVACGRWFNRMTGAALVGLGVRLAIAKAAD
ncbi:LysE family transporter [Methyloraptor flagellatus]|uniref:LysE family transporter n=1 Tax=Methyloraptor flagellatus TaxID=3162530 RepID=A0AAU7X8F1_9HYPH